MPQIIKIGPYVVYFWSNENDPLEPVHVHVREGKPAENGTKIWITKKGKCVLANNRSKIPEARLALIMRIIEAESDDIIIAWRKYFGEISYFC